MRASKDSFEAEEVECEAVRDIIHLTRNTFSRPELYCSNDEGFQETETPRTSHQWSVHIGSLSQIDDIIRSRQCLVISLLGTRSRDAEILDLHLPALASLTVLYIKFLTWELLLGG
jgi:hypothetical protein